MNTYQPPAHVHVAEADLLSEAQLPGVHQDNLRTFPGGRDFKHRLERRLGLVNTMHRLIVGSTGSMGSRL